ncbi:MAG: response regulator [Opitutaceae bacterium]|nr:response regulator [Opitutaceae bacterium]
MTRTILIVDDNELYRGMLRSLLILHGYTVLAAANAAEALALAETHPIDAMLTDVDMPGMDGIELCRQLHARASDRNETIPVWVMTGMLRPGLTKRTRDAGALVVLRKPFNVVDTCKQFELEFEARTGKLRTPQIA